MAIDKTRCPLCIWHNDEMGKCEGYLDNIFFFNESPFYKAHPELLPARMPLGHFEDDCVGMTYRPGMKKKAVVGVQQ